jgi:hypothetical protein
VINTPPQSGPAMELAGILIARLTADSGIQARLFPPWSPHVTNSVTGEPDPQDTRIYRASAELPQNPVEVRSDPYPAEQREGNLRLASCRIYIHSLAPKEHDRWAEGIDMRARYVVTSGALVSAAIRASAPEPAGPQAAQFTEEQFNSARRYTSEYASAIVEVLAA